MRTLRFFTAINCLLLSCSIMPTFAATIDNPVSSTVLNIFGTSDADTIINEGTVTESIFGNSEGENDSGFNIITNSGLVNYVIIGSDNMAVDSNGGANSIINTGRTEFIIGSSNEASGSTGGANSIINAGQAYAIYGSGNVREGSSGGDNNITNSGLVLEEGIFGSYNIAADSSGGFNTIINSGTVGSSFDSVDSVLMVQANTADAVKKRPGRIAGGIIGSFNEGTGSNGGSNSITNSGTLSGGIGPRKKRSYINGLVGSLNIGAFSSGGENSIINSGTINNIFIDVADPFNILINEAEQLSGIIGSYNIGSGGNGGSNNIINSGTVSTEVIVSVSDPSGILADQPSGMTSSIYGSANMGLSSTGGSNSITNSGTVSGSLYGSYNWAIGSNGGSNSIDNTGTVAGDIYGSYNLGTGDLDNNAEPESVSMLDDGSGDAPGLETTGSSSTGNDIINSGTVAGSIYGSYNYDADSHGGDDTIINSGIVNGSIYGEDGNDTMIAVGGSTVGGVFDGGIDFDTLGFDDMGEVTADNYLNFENMSIYGGSTTLTGIFDFSTGQAIVYAGKLLVDGDLSTSSFIVERDGLADIAGSVSSGTTIISGGMKLSAAI